MINFHKKMQIVLVIGLMSQAAIAEPVPTEATKTKNATTSGALTGHVSEHKTKPLNGRVSKSESQKQAALKAAAQSSDLNNRLQAQQPSTQDQNVNEPELRIKTSRNVNEPQLKAQTPGVNERNGNNNQNGSNENGGVNEPNGDNNQSGQNN